MVPGAYPELGTHEKFSAVNSSVLIANIRLDQKENTLAYLSEASLAKI